MIDNVKESFREPVQSAYDRWMAESRMEGMVEGDQKRIRISFKNMYDEGLDLPTIARFLGITEEQATVILEEMQEEGEVC